MFRFNFLTKVKLRFFSSMPTYKPVTHIIFDIDGLLLKTEDIYYKADCMVISQFGKTYPWNLRMKVLGVTEHQCANSIVSELKLPITPDEYERQVKAIAFKLLKNAPLMPGAERLVKHFYENKVPLAVATSSGAESVEAKRFNHQKLFNMFHHIVMASSDPEVKHGKPEPDIFLVCASRFPDKPDPEKCLVFEDAPNGVKAALQAGMQVVMVPEDYVSIEDRKKATLALKSLNNFQPELFGLPSF